MPATPAPLATTQLSRAPHPLWLALFALAAWLPTLRLARFAGDDRELILENPAVDGALPWTAAFARDYFHHVGDAGQYRPLSTLSLRFERAFWEVFGIAEQAAPFHAGNALLHAGVVLLAACALRRVLRGRAWIGLAFFAAHPVLADSVAWISGRTSMVAALLGAAGALALVRALESRRAALALPISCVGLLGALGGKEDGVAFALVYSALSWRSSQRALAFSVAGSALALAIYLAARGAALGVALPRASEPVLANAGFVERAQLGGAAALEALRIAVLPIGYPPQYRTEMLLERSSLAQGFAAVLGWSAWLAALVASACFAARASARPAAASIAAAALAFAPALHLVPIGEAFAPRFLYLPLLFAAPFASALALRLPLASSRPTRRALAAAAAATLLAACWQRASVYAGRGAYRREVLRFQPADARSWNELGLALEEEADDLDGARAAWLRATELAPEYSRPWSNLGRVALARGELDLAERMMRRAVRVGPENPIAHANLASLLLRREAFDEAAEQYGRATEIAPGFAPAWRGLGNALLSAGERERAVQALARALELDPKDAAACALHEQAMRE